MRLDGEEMLGRSRKQMRKVWGTELSMVPQDPMTSLNPVRKVGDQITEPLRHHLSLDKREARETALALLGSVRIPDPEKRLGEYPHQLSGGMRQRIVIAAALACGPRLLFADEPTTALDVTVQAQILNVLRRMQQERHMAMVLVTHDLGVVAGHTDEIIVMYAGQVVEQASTADLFAQTRACPTPRHCSPRSQIWTRRRPHPDGESSLDGPPTWYETCRQDADSRRAVDYAQDRPAARTEPPPGDRRRDPATPIVAGFRSASPLGRRAEAVSVSAAHTPPTAPTDSTGSERRMPDVVGTGTSHLSRRRPAARPTRSWWSSPSAAPAPRSHDVSGISIDVAPGARHSASSVSLAVRQVDHRAERSLQIAPTKYRGRVHPRRHAISDRLVRLTSCGGRERRKIQMIFQDPISSLNPKHSIVRTILT